MANDEEKIVTPGADLDFFVFEQTEEGLIFWDKKLRKRMEPDLTYEALSDCPWQLAKTLEPYVNENQLWEEIKTFLIHHVFLPDERLYDVLTAWVLASWIPEKWDVIPYLLIRAPMGCGKTRLLETLGAIAYRGIFSANMTSAALFRVLELHRPTIFLDETEIYNKEEYSDVTHLLNAGYRRGQRAWRVERDKDGLPYVKGYDVFGFKAMAGTQELARTLHSRSIVIDMVKNIQPVNFTVNEKIAQKLRNRLLQWRFDKLSTLCEHCEDSEDSEGVYPPPILELSKSCPDGRLLELFYCLLSVANEGTENIMSFAKTMYESRESEEQASLQYACLEAMLKCKEDVIDGKILAKTVKDKMNEGLEDKEKFSTRFVLKLLSNLGFQKAHLRKGNGIVWNEKMLVYRAKQYRIEGGYVLQESSLSSQSSPNGDLPSEVDEENKFGEHISSQVCSICLKPLPEDMRDTTTYGGKFVHLPCFLKLKEGLKNEM